LSSGAYRNVYEILDVKPRVVIKFPQDEDTRDIEESISHAAIEMAAFEKIQRSKKFARHFPEIFYMDADRGVMVMKKYWRGRFSWDYDTYKVQRPKEVRLMKRLERFFRNPDGDFGWGNFVYDDAGIPIIIDLGLV